MRDIKFRAWDKVNKIIVGDIQKAYDGMGYECLNGDYYGYVCCFDSFICDDFEVMQYTGLKDKNGVEIYEGDICSIDSYNIGNDELFEVKWDNDSARFLLKEDDLNFVLNDFYLNSVEVIGNIYENPELLEVNKNV